MKNGLDGRFHFILTIIPTFGNIHCHTDWIVNQKIQTRLRHSGILAYVSGMLIIFINFTCTNVGIFMVIFFSSNFRFPFDQKTFPVGYNAGLFFPAVIRFSSNLRRWYFNQISKRSLYYSNCIHKRHQTKTKITEWASESRTPKPEENRNSLRLKCIRKVRNKEK